jgi:hypothetical protein
MQIYKRIASGELPILAGAQFSVPDVYSQMESIAEKEGPDPGGDRLSRGTSSGWRPTTRSEPPSRRAADPSRKEPLAIPG